MIKVLLSLIVYFLIIIVMPRCRLMVELVKEESNKVEETTEQVLGKL